MKQHRISFRALGALLCLVLCALFTACGKEGASTPKSASDGRYNDSLITEAFSEEGAFTDEFDQEWIYAYHIPQLEDDTADAEAINEEIMARFGSGVQATLDSLAAAGYPETYYMDISWQSHWNGSLLSLSMKAVHWASDMVSYQVYHYDFADGRQLTNAQVLERFAVSEGDFLSALRRAAAQRFDAVLAPVGMPGTSASDEDFGSLCIELNVLRAETIAEENLSLDDALFFPNGDGSFTAFQPIASPAGAGWYYEALRVQPGGGRIAGGRAPQAEYAYVTARLSDDGAAVRFTRHEDGMFDSEASRPYVGFSYNTDYPIAACCGEYQDIFVGTFGSGMSPYVFLLTRGGTVEYADIFGGFESGLLCSGGPLYGLHDIVGFENGEREGGYEEGYQTVYAVDKNGERYDLAGRITPMTNAMPLSLAGEWYTQVRHGTDGGGSYTSSYLLSFSENGFTSIEDLVEDMEDLSIDYGGYCTYLGMTERGMVYRFNLYNSDNDVRSGTFVLDCRDIRNDSLTISPISGVNLFDAPEGGSTAFVRAYG